jgi:hypothetical protein
MCSRTSGTRPLGVTVSKSMNRRVELLELALELLLVGGLGDDRERTDRRLHDLLQGPER